MSSIIRATTTSGLQVAPDNSGSLQLQTNGTTTAVTIDTSQNVGIGTTTPAYKLDIVGANSTPAFRVATNSGTSANDAGVLILNVASATAANRISYLYLDPNGANSTGGDYFYLASDGAANAYIWNQNSGPILFGISSSERMRIDTSGNLLFNSGYGSVATAYGCRAWVNFNGTGTVAIRASGNVSSITDNGTGNYTVNFTNAMPDANYALNGTVNINNTTGSGYMLTYPYNSTPNVNSARVSCDSSASRLDMAYVNIAVFR